MTGDQDVDHLGYLMHRARAKFNAEPTRERSDQVILSERNYYRALADFYRRQALAAASLQPPQRSVA